MTQSYILVEGINLGANIYDTDQLSVIRGSSFLLKDAIKKIKTEFSNTLIAISTGASSGLFKVKTEIMEDHKRKIIELLQNDPDFRLMTFLVETVSESDLLKAKEKLLTQLRIHQLQSITSIPDSSINNSPGECSLDGVRSLGGNSKTIGGEPVSDSVFQRWQYGRGKKQDFYVDEVKDIYPVYSKYIKQYEFTQDLESLASSPNCSGKPCYPKLDNKIAVFYADGNDFGKIQRTLLKAEANKKQKGGIKADVDQLQQRIDKAIGDDRSIFLADALGHMLPGNDALFQDMTYIEKTNSNKNDENGAAQEYTTESQKILRFETLLWGGDEMLMVMPAWIGMDFLQFFFEKSKDWKIEGIPVSHSAGIVFCRANTPIPIIRQLAQALADNIKDKAKEQEKDKQNSWDYMVLESIDYPIDNDIDKFMRERYGQLAKRRPMFIPPCTDWIAARTVLDKLTGENGLPTRQLYQLATLLTRNPPDEVFACHNSIGWQMLCAASTDDSTVKTACPLEQQERRMLEVCEFRSSLIKQIHDWFAFLGLDIERLEHRAWGWLHLLELKDYLIPKRSAGA